MDILSFMLGKAAGGGGGGGGDITVEQLNVSSNNTYTAPSGKAYSPVVVNVPNSYTQSDEGKVVSNGALVAQTSDTVTQNGTVDTTLINSLSVNVSGGGGTSNVKEGTITIAEGVNTIDTGYAGSGYPIAVFVTVDGGLENTSNTTWYDTICRYTIGEMFVTKADTTVPPQYLNTNDDRACRSTIFKSSASSATSINNNYAATNVYLVGDPTNSNGAAIRINDAKTVKLFGKASTDADHYAFLAGVEYRYWIVYSE